MVSILGWQLDYETGFSTVWAKIGSQTPFTNSCEECANYVDNGAGLSWDGRPSRPVDP